MAQKADIFTSLYVRSSGLRLLLKRELLYA